MHLSVQPPEVEEPRQALFPAHATVSRHVSEDLRYFNRPHQIRKADGTTGWGLVSQGDTRLPSNQIPTPHRKSLKPTIPTYACLLPRKPWPGNRSMRPGVNGRPCVRR